MQHCVNIPYHAVVFFMQAFLICIILISRIVVVMKRLKKTEKLLNEGIECKDDILNEFRKIRHEYNNILQVILCLIEEEDVDGLKEYKDMLLQKTQTLNQNSITQLTKIHDQNILVIVHNILIKAKEAGITLKLSVYNDIGELAIDEGLLEGLKLYVEYIYADTLKYSNDFNLTIKGNEDALSIAFESVFDGISQADFKEQNVPKKYDNILVNNFSADGLFTREVILTFHN